MQTDEILRLNNIYKRLLANAAVKLYEGEGRIVGPNEVEVRQIDGTKISYTAKHILIATGSRAQKPNIPGHVSFCVHVILSTIATSVNAFSIYEILFLNASLERF